MSVPAFRVTTLVALLGCSWCAPGCIAPSVLAHEERAVAATEVAPAWGSVRESDLDGWFESTHIEGDAAISFLRIEYFFAADGTYSGAALAIDTAGPEFQTLIGRWRLDGDQLDLGEGNSARVQAAPGWLKLESEGGSVVLRRVENP